MSSFVLTNSTPLHPRKLGHPLRSSLRCGFVLRFACTHLALSVTSTSLHPPLAAVGLRSSSPARTRSAGLRVGLLRGLFPVPFAGCRGRHPLQIVIPVSYPLSTNNYSLGGRSQPLLFHAAQLAACRLPPLYLNALKNNVQRRAGMCPAFCGRPARSVDRIVS